MSSIFLNIEPTFAVFKSSGKQLFLKDKSIIVVRTEAWISIVDFNILAEYLQLGWILPHLILNLFVELCLHFPHERKNCQAY